MRKALPEIDPDKIDDRVNRAFLGTFVLAAVAGTLAEAGISTAPSIAIGGFAGAIIYKALNRDLPPPSDPPKG